MNKFNKNKFTAVVLGVLLVLVVAAVVALGIRLGKSQTYTSLSSGDYIVGTLDSTGEFKKDGGNIVTKEFYKIDGLTVKVKEDSEVAYRLYFYKENKEFISSTNNFGVTYNGTIPEDVVYFKIVINPINDSDISQWDIINYSSQVNVKYYK